MNNQNDFSRYNSITGFAHMLLLVIVIVAVGAGGWWMWKNDKLNVAVEGPVSSPPETGMQNDHKATLIKLDETINKEDWKTYVDSTNNFSFKYPQEWHIIIDNNKPINTPQEDRVQFIFYDNPLNASKCKDQLDQNTNCDIRETLGINVQIEPIQIDMENELSKYALETTYNNSEVPRIKLNGINWTLFLGGTSGGAVGHTAWSVQGDNLIMIDFYQPSTNEEKYYPEGDHMSNQILSTFKFAESEQNYIWKTYTNTKHNYSIQYPSDFTAVANVADSPAEGTPSPEAFDIYIYKSGDNEPYLNRYINIQAPSIEPSMSEDFSVSETNIDSSPAKKYTNPNSSFDIYHIDNPNAQGIIEIYVVNTKEKSEMADEILSTFEFTQL